MKPSQQLIATDVKPNSPISGFTLVELLVAMAILALLVLLVTQITNSTSTTTKTSMKHLDADSQARTIFDRMSADFDKMLKRRDVDYIFSKQVGNDAMFFYSEAPAYFTGSPSSSARSTTALVGYRINSNNQLERLGKGLTWDGLPGSTAGGSVIFLTYPAGSSTPESASTLLGNWPNTVTASSTDSDYNVLSNSAYRLEFCFLMKAFTDSSGNLQPAILLNTPWDTRQVGHTTSNGLQDVAAIVVAIAILDTASQKIVFDKTKMIDALPDDGTPIVPTWAAVVNTVGFAQTSGIPQTAASQVRTYQRYFYLNTR